MDISSTQYIPNTNSKIENLKGSDLSAMDKKKLKEAAEGLEAEFLKVFLKQSKSIIEKQSDDKNKAPGKDIMTDFMLERIAEDMAKKSPLGISKMIIEDVEKKYQSKQEKSDNSSKTL
ncbi:MAG: rod-binding protein [Peptostreptococcaceae bacterium]|nr:rod-binding protein [uncultured Criibacterium sp.]MBS6062587.1 rod-binding protein [Peptostreptococcaceae bacterium]